MNYAIIIHKDTAKDHAKQNQVVDQLRKTQGVLKLDTEMANNGLILAQLNSSADLEAIGDIDGVQELEKMGVKHAL